MMNCTTSYEPRRAMRVDPNLRPNLRDDAPAIRPVRTRMLAAGASIANDARVLDEGRAQRCTRGARAASGDGERRECR
jgi:hypothetical protein